MTFSYSLLNIIFSGIVLFGVILRGYAQLVFKFLDINSFQQFMNVPNQILNGLLCLTFGSLGLLMLNTTNPSQTPFAIHRIEGKINLTFLVLIIVGMTFITHDILSITWDIISSNLVKK